MFQVLDKILIFIYKKKIYSFGNRKRNGQLYYQYSYAKLVNLTNDFFKKKISSNNLYQQFRIKTDKELIDQYFKKLIFYRLASINHQINLHKEFYDKKKLIYLINEFDISFLFNYFNLKRNNFIYLNIFLIYIKICLKNLKNLFYINQFYFLKKKNIKLKLKYKNSILINKYFGLNLYNKNDLFFVKLLKKKYNILFYDYKDFFLIEDLDFKLKKFKMTKFHFKSIPPRKNFKFTYFNIFNFTKGFLNFSINYFEKRKYFWDEFIKKYNISFVINNPANSYDIFPLKYCLKNNNSKLINFQNSSFTNIYGLFYLHYISDYFFCFSNFQKKLGLSMNKKMFHVNKLINVNNFFDIDHCIDNNFYEKIKKFKSNNFLLIFTDSSFSNLYSNYFQQLMSIKELDIYYLSILKIIDRFKSDVKIVIKSKKISLNQLEKTNNFVNKNKLNNSIFFDDLNHSRNFAIYNDFADICYSITYEFPTTLFQFNSKNVKLINFDYGGSINIKIPKIKTFKNFDDSISELNSSLIKLITNKSNINKFVKKKNNHTLFVHELNKIM